MDKRHDVKNYIKEETGIDISKNLLAFIMNPQKLEGLNNSALNDIVIEYAPIFKKLGGMLDGPNWLASFNLSLKCRISHKPELERILGLSE